MNRRFGLPVALIALCSIPAICSAQEAPAPSLRAGVLPSSIAVDGVLDEAAWDAAEKIDAFTQVDPIDGGPPTARTIVRVLAGPKALAIGVVCEDSAPKGIVSFSVRR